MNTPKYIVGISQDSVFKYSTENKGYLFVGKLNGRTKEQFIKYYEEMKFQEEKYYEKMKF